MVKFSIVLILIAIVSCNSVIHNKSDLIDPKIVRSQIVTLKLNGFYYCELSKLNIIDSKAIMTFLLYENGYVINDGIYFGNSTNYCTSVNNNENSIANSINKYKSRLKLLGNAKFNSCKIKNGDINGKGLFLIKNDSIIIQYFKAELKNEKKDSFNDYFLYELKGIIINDQSFHLMKLKDYRRNKEYEIDQLYKFENDENVPRIDNRFL
ncbi:hypothetical protein [Flavobacterium aquidurense]|uniref:Lipoprotein n=1 Tax=Flavobacterium aquidurense TaxID=362413 RepID=A0A0Q0XXG4_9FLAO|nr:hypothetical protein [Flavobacterium aquidurense]KQB41123.1 hypothetical protein RC62_4498 [Flavobacterium aquidurense]